MAKLHVSTTVNGEPAEFLCEPQHTLLDALRNELHLTGSKEGCGSGDCGACTVIMDDVPVRACITLAAQASGARIRTVEGLASDGGLHPLQKAFKRHHALQCGFCTPGFLTTAAALLEQIPDPTETQVREWLSGNICRCTGYQFIVDAVLAAAREMKAG